MPHDFPKTFDFHTLEPQIYEQWEKKGYFQPWNDPNKPGFDPSVKPFVIAMPPPNVTGELHLGHAMMLAVEDLMIRYHRMRGEPTLWVPGTDHAGIATQLQVEKALAKEGKTRYDLGREAFEKRVWEWKEKYGGIIIKQIRRMGASCDWTRLAFTLDPGYYRAVLTAFVHLWEKGLIYRDYRIINWSPGLQTAVSDLEVEYVEIDGTKPPTEAPEGMSLKHYQSLYQVGGKLYFFKYMLADGSGDYIPVSTTRPETILADTAVAVHPEDERYQKYVGKEVVVPILGRKIPVIADPRVDREFGTGALKITPGHDPVDFEIGKDHGLPIILVMDERGRMNEHAGPYEGLDRFEARKRLWEDMEKAGLTLGVKPYKHRIPIAQRGGEPIEPMASVQWFVKIKPLAEPALRVVEEGKIRIVPERFAKVYRNWMENIRDWCISRQLWWGHRIPAWYCADCQAEDGRPQAEHIHVTFIPPLEHNGRTFDTTTYAELRAAGLSAEEIFRKAARITVGLKAQPIVSLEKPERCPVCGSTDLVQDPDVLDTWFSSALWPFATLGWPEDTPDLRYFYPTTVMETGYDILFFWVARMIMAGLEHMGEIPFELVYLHGLIRDEFGRKMSKTLGNVIDPLDVIQKYGTDALRFTLLVGVAPGNDLNMSMKKVEGNQKFINKLWNMGRAVLRMIGQIADSRQPSAVSSQRTADGQRPTADGRRPTADRWILIRLNQTMEAVQRLFDRHLYGEAGKVLYEFLWDEFADWYLEIAKTQVRQGGEGAYHAVQTAVKVLETSLRLLHPFIPFVTEALWGHLKAAVMEAFGADNPDFTPQGGWPEMLMVARWPQAEPLPEDADQVLAFMETFQGLVRAIRNYRAQNGLPPKQPLRATVVAGADASVLREMAPVLAFLARLDEAHLRIVEQADGKPEGTAVVSGSWTAYLDFSMDEELLRARLQKRLAEVEAQIARLEKLLAGPFSQKAPAHVVQKERDKLARFREEAETLRKQLGG